MDWKSFTIIGLAVTLWPPLIETKETMEIHSKIELPTATSTFLADKLDKFSRFFTTWLRRLFYRRQSFQDDYEQLKDKVSGRSGHYKYKVPPRNKFYNPNYGYEPYWADGDWVMDWFHNLEAQNDTVCEIKCEAMHFRFGEICGKNKRLESRTFKNICEMRQYDCPDDDGWAPLYRGECRQDLKYISTLLSTTVTPLPVKSMAPIYIQEFIDRHPELHLHLN